jgi:hypothetical protein
MSVGHAIKAQPSGGALTSPAKFCSACVMNEILVPVNAAEENPA